MIYARIVTRTFTILALGLWLLSVFQGRLRISHGMGELGIFSVLPVTFYVSLSLLSASFLLAARMRGGGQPLLFFQTVMLILFLSFTPVVIEETPRFSTAYSNYVAVDYISQTGHINPEKEWIHNWPGFSIAYSSLMQVAMLPERVLLSVYTTFFNMLLFFVLFILFRLILDDMRGGWIAIWTFYIANWVGQDYFSMQSLGLLAFILMLFIAFKLMNSGAYAIRWRVLLILLFSVVVTSHMLSSLAILAVLFVFLLFKYLRKTLLVFILIALLFAWNLYVSTAYFERNLVNLLAQALDFELIFQANVGARVSGNPARIVVTEARVVFSALIAVFTLSGLILTWKRSKTGKIDRWMGITLAGLGCLLGLSAYGGELFMRIFILSLVPLCYFVYKGISEKMFLYAFALFLIVACPPLHIVAHYGNESMDYVPPSEVTGVEFFYTITTEGYVIGGTQRGYRDLRYRESYRYIPLSSAEWKAGVLSIDQSLGPITSERSQWSRFVCISYGIREWYDFVLDELWFVVGTSENLTRSPSYDKVYSNPGLDVYLQLRRW